MFIYVKIFPRGGRGGGGGGRNINTNFNCGYIPLGLVSNLVNIPFFAFVPVGEIIMYLVILRVSNPMLN